MKSSAKSKRNKVFLTAHSKDGKVVEELTLSSEEYYENLADLIDKASYRAERGILRIVGKIFDPSGNLGQEFESHYDEDGVYVRGKAVYQDGTVIEN